MFDSLRSMFSRLNVFRQISDLREQVERLAAENGTLTVENFKLTSRIASRPTPQQVLDKIGYDRATQTLNWIDAVPTADEPSDAELTEAEAVAQDPAFRTAVDASKMRGLGRRARLRRDSARLQFRWETEVRFDDESRAEQQEIASLFEDFWTTMPETEERAARRKEAWARQNERTARRRAFIDAEMKSWDAAHPLSAFD